MKQQQAILAFINAGGLEDLEFVNSIEYRRSFEVPPPICDAYHFKSGFSVGYISFFFGSITFPVGLDKAVTKYKESKASEYLKLIA